MDVDTQRKLRSTRGSGHIVLFNTLAIGHTKHPNEHRISSSWPFAAKKLRGANSQDFVFMHPPGISHGAFELRMDNVWFCKILLLFQVESKADLGLKRHSCAFVSVLEEYTKPRRPGKSPILLILLLDLLYLLYGSGSLVGYRMRIENNLRTQHAVASSVCCTHYFNLGATCSDACWRYGHYSVFHAQRETRL